MSSLIIEKLREIGPYVAKKDLGGGMTAYTIGDSPTGPGAIRAALVVPSGTDVDAINDDVMAEGHKRYKEGGDV